MADEELAAIRAKRLEELQKQYGVCCLQFLGFNFQHVSYLPSCDIQGQDAAQMQQQQEAIQRCSICHYIWLILGVKTCDVFLCWATVVGFFFIVFPSLFS